MSAGSNNVGSETDVDRADKAVFTILCPNSISFSGPNVGSPHTCSILPPRTTLGAPVVSASEYIADIIATGIPAFSISLATVAPQRLQVPQVATKRAPDTFASDNSAAIPAPIFFESTMAVPTPLVVKNQG